MRSPFSRLRRAWLLGASIGCGLVLIALWSWLYPRVTSEVPAPAPVAELPVPPAPRQPLRGIVLDRRKAPQPHVAVALYAIPLDDVEPSRCGGAKPAHLFEETCAAAQTEVKRRLEANELASKPLEGVETDEEGRFEFSVPMGRYDLVVIGRTSGFGLALDASPGGELLTITLGQDVARGKVTTVNEFPLPDAKVAVVLTRPRLVWMAETSPAGEFVVGPVPSDRELVAWANAKGYVPAVDRLSPERDAFVFSLWPDVRLTGHVRFAGDQVAGAEISGDCGEARSNREGAFVLEAGTCRDGEVIARKGTLFGTASASVALSAGLELELFQTKPISVHVVDAVTKQPMAAKVTASVPQSPFGKPLDLPPLRFRTETRAAGNIVLHDLPPGAYTIAAEAEGFAIGSEDISSDNDSVTIEMKHGQSVRARVVDENERPVAGAVVTWRETQATTDGAGAFAFQHVGGDKMEFSVAANGFETEWATLDLKEDGVRTIELARQFALRVRVKGLDGQPVPHASVECAQETGGAPVSKGTSDEHGVAVCGLNHLRADVSLIAFLRVSASGFAAVEDQFFEVPDGQPSEVEVVLESELMLGGTVVDERGRPVPGVTVMALHEDERQVHEAVAGAGGEFLFQHLGSGTHEIRVLNRSPVGNPEEPFVRAQAGETNVRVVLSRKMTVRGTVKRDGVPVPRLLLNDAAVLTHDGGFVFDLAPETNGELTLKGDFMPMTRSIKVVPGTETDLGVIEVEPLGAIDAKVTNAANRARAWVGRAVASGEMASDYVDIDESGHFLASHRAPGRYLVIVNTDRGEFQRECEVRSGQRTTLELALPKGTMLKDSNRSIYRHDDILEAASR